MQHELVNSLFPLVFLFLIFYFIIIRPQQKQAKEHKQMLNDLKRGDKVITNGGIYGEVVSVDDDSVKLRVDKESIIKVEKTYILKLQQTQKQNTQKPEKEDKKEDKK